MKKTIALLISCILMATMSLAQVNPIAGVYKYTHPDGAEGTIYVATGQGGNVYFEASSVTSSGNTANFHPFIKLIHLADGGHVVAIAPCVVVEDHPHPFISRIGA